PHQRERPSSQVRDTQRLPGRPHGIEHVPHPAQIFVHEARRILEVDMRLLHAPDLQHPAAHDLVLHDPRRLVGEAQLGSALSAGQEITGDHAAIVDDPCPAPPRATACPPATAPATMGPWTPSPSKGGATPSAARPPPTFPSWSRSWPTTCSGASGRAPSSPRTSRRSPGSIVTRISCSWPSATRRAS